MSRATDDAADPQPHPGTPHRTVAGGVPTPDIDLGGSLGTMAHAEALDAEIRHEVAGLFSRAPGVALVSLAHETPPVRTRSAHVRATFIGWSPSLHSLLQHVSVHAPREPDGDVDVGELLRELVPTVAAQAARAASARHMGLHAPLPVPAIISDMEVRHLLVDASLPALLADAGERPAEHLADRLHAMHAPSSKGTTEAAAHITTGDAHVIECGLGRMLGASAHVDRGPSIYLAYDGLALEVSGLPAIPESALPQLAGRPFSDVAPGLHPALDDRIVQDAESDGRRMRFRFVPRLLDWRDWSKENFRG